MTIEEFADIVGLDLEIVRYANQGNRYVVQFRDTDVKETEDDPTLRCVYGEGFSIRDALADYVQKISGKWLVVDVDGQARRRFSVPMILGYRDGEW